MVPIAPGDPPAGRTPLSKSLYSRGKFNGRVRVTEIYAGKLKSSAKKMDV
jgi:hypothetical protein